jgi:hypothetical protein
MKTRFENKIKEQEVLEKETYLDIGYCCMFGLPMMDQGSWKYSLYRHELVRGWYKYDIFAAPLLRM